MQMSLASCLLASVLAIFAVSLQGCGDDTPAKPKPKPKPDKGPDCGSAFKKDNNWALLAAGSKGWGDYRFQANVCRAYQVLKDRGFREDHIVVMMFNDVAYAPENPFKGKMYYHPDSVSGGPIEVYEGCNIDYSGAEVTAANFLRVLQGKSVKTGGRVINSDKDSNIFIYLSSHGYSGTGDIAFPNDGWISSDYLSASSLLMALESMEKNRKYSEVAIFVNACYSGLIFKDQKLKGVYAMTSATDACSYGKYRNRKVRGVQINTSLASQFADAWTDYRSMRQTTLDMQYAETKFLMTHTDPEFIPGRYYFQNPNIIGHRSLACFFGYHQKMITSRNIHADHDIVLTSGDKHSIIASGNTSDPLAADSDELNQTMITSGEANGPLTAEIDDFNQTMAASGETNDPPRAEVDDWNQTRTASGEANDPSAGEIDDLSASMVVV